MIQPPIAPADVAVTTSLSPDDEVVLRASSAADSLACPFLNREELSLEEVRDTTKRKHLIVFTATEVRFVSEGETFWFHPNMASARIEAVLRGEPDRLSDYMDYRDGDRVLDLTCGLGADAIVAAHFSGSDGCVRAVEASPVLGLLVREGMKIYSHRTVEVEEAMRRVEVVTGEALETLVGQPDDSWDLVFLDPMFDDTIRASSGFEIVRRLACDVPVTGTMIHEAARVASRAVVMKDRTPGKQLRDFGFEDIQIRGRICYGRIQA